MSEEQQQEASAAPEISSIDAGVAEISAGLGFGEQKEDGESDFLEESADPIDEPVENDPVEAEAKPVEEKPVERPFPKSWAKETAELWSKIPPEAQEQILHREKQMLDGLEQYKGDAGLGRQLREVITPYKAMLQAQGIDEPKAVQTLLNAHYRLTNGTPIEKAQYFATLAKSYAIDLQGLPQGQEQQNVDPVVRELQEKVNALQSGLTAREQASFNEAKARVSQQVAEFAENPKNVYFDEVADDIIKLIGTGESLESAYEKAVWANPVTRAKEIARVQTENEKSLREKAAAEAKAALRATSSNIRTRDTSKAPTEPNGKLFGRNHEAEMREIVRKGTSRAH